MGSAPGFFRYFLEPIKIAIYMDAMDLAQGLVQTQGFYSFAIGERV